MVLEEMLDAPAQVGFSVSGNTSTGVLCGLFNIGVLVSRFGFSELLMHLKLLGMYGGECRCRELATCLSRNESVKSIYKTMW